MSCDPTLVTNTGIPFTVSGGGQRVCPPEAWVRVYDGPPRDYDQAAAVATDAAGQTVILFQDQWSCDFFAQRHPRIRLSALSHDVENAEASVPA